MFKFPIMGRSGGPEILRVEIEKIFMIHSPGG
jgi:hypothetical protein